MSCKMPGLNNPDQGVPKINGIRLHATGILNGIFLKGSSNQGKLIPWYGMRNNEYSMVGTTFINWIVK